MSKSNESLSINKSKQLSFTFNNIKQNTSTYDKLKFLKNSPTDLWIILILKFFESLAYFTTSFILVIYLSEEFDLDDEQAGLLYGLSGICVCMYGLFMGFIIDYIGIKPSLLIGFSFLMLYRLLFTVSENYKVIIFSLFVLRPLGSCMGIPVMQIAIKRYTDSNTRAPAYSLFYLAMNMAAMLAAPLSDYVRINMKEGYHVNWVGKELYLSSYRLTYGVSLIVTFVNLLVVNLVREVKYYDGYNLNYEQNNADENLSNSYNPNTSNTIYNKSDNDIITDVIATRAFCKFMTFVLLLTGVRCVFRNLDATFPKYMIREYGNEIKFGSILALNPLLVSFMVPLMMVFSQKMDTYTQICYGILITTLSPLFLALETSIWMALIFVFVLSLGESIWSPRLYEYSMDIAKEGREGTYIALSSAPLFLSSFISGTASGYLLERYCPKEMPKEGRESWKLWLIISVCSSMCSLCIIVFDKHLRINKGDEFEKVDFVLKLFGRYKNENTNSYKNIKELGEVTEEEILLKLNISTDEAIKKAETEFNYSFNEEYNILETMKHKKE